MTSPIDQIYKEFPIDDGMEGELRPAGFWRRYFAHAIDAAILSIPLVIYAFVIGANAGARDYKAGLPSHPDPSAALAPILYEPRNWHMILAATLLIAVLYHSLMEVTEWRGSVGKHFTGIKVIRVKGGQVSFLRALARNILAYAFGILTLGIGHLIMLFNKRKRTLHDMASGCWVVRGGA